MSKQNVELVEAIYEAFLRRDMGFVFSRLAADVVLVQSTEVPWGGRYEGAEGFQRFFVALTAHLESAALPVERYLDAGDHVVAIGRTQGTVRATGKRFDVPLAHVWEIREGKVARFCPYIDHPSMGPLLTD